jgi:putative transposase
MTDIVKAGLKRWLIIAPDRTASGIASRTMSAARSSTWRWSFPNSRRGSLAVRFTDERKYFVSEASVYRLLKAHDLITSPAYVVIKAANEFKDKTTAINQLWQTDFTYLKITGWGWYYLSTVLDDFSRYIVAWRLGPTMCASDVTATLDQALTASGLDHIAVAHRPRLLSDNGASYVAGDLADWLEGKGMQHVRGAPYHPQTQGKIERWHQTLKNRILLENYYLPGDRTTDRRLRRALQSRSLS